MRPHLPRKIQIKEVGPRDGLQNETFYFSTNQKVEMIAGLVQAGLSYVETTAFVNPRVIPALADAEEVARRIQMLKGTFSALVPNQKGMERALASGFKEVAVFTAASETFNQKNIQTSIEGGFERFSGVFPLAKREGVKVRGYISTCFYCPYEGEIAPKKVLEIALRLLKMGCYEISIGDTIGKAVPTEISKLFSLLLKKIPAKRLAGHFHDTRGTALANVIACAELGISTFDSSVGGLGGCPYAPGASGNLATEDLVYAFERMGVETGVSIPKLIEVSRKLETLLKRPLTSKVFRSWSN